MSVKTHPTKSPPYEKRTLRKKTLQKNHPTKKNPTKNAPYEKKPYKNAPYEKITLRKTHSTKKGTKFFFWLCALREAYFASHTNYVFRVPLWLGAFYFGAFLLMVLF